MTINSFKLDHAVQEKKEENVFRCRKLYSKYLTVKYFELTDDGIPRFPVGLAVRDYE